MNFNLKLLTKSGLLAVSLSAAPVFAADVHWDYSDPANWGNLSEEYALCSQGQKQSPVDINRTSERKMYELRMSYADTGLNVKNNGHTLQVNYNDPGTLRIGDKSYRLLQFHFHTPSEHTKGGNAYPMEVHFVHQSDEGELAVVGVFMKEGLHNEVMEKILHNAPHEVSTVNVVGESINAKQLMPREASEEYYHYSGSLTTPPCSEGVRWFVLQNKIEVSAEQVAEFAEFVHGHNARPTQPLFNRTVYRNDN